MMVMNFNEKTPKIKQQKGFNDGCFLETNTIDVSIA